VPDRRCVRHVTPRIERRGVESSQQLGRLRWVVARTLAWLRRFRRLRVRDERRAQSHYAFLTLGRALFHRPIPVTSVDSLS
jgi:hypothetical protein